VSLVHLYTRHGDCKVDIREHGTKMSNSLVGVDYITLTCDEHGELDRYTMVQYPKYRLALQQARADGAAHLGLDKASWAVLD
jgi:hypothetical protein